MDSQKTVYVLGFGVCVLVRALRVQQSYRHFGVLEKGYEGIKGFDDLRKRSNH